MNETDTDDLSDVPCEVSKTVTYRGTTATIDVTVESDGALDADERGLLADSLIDAAIGTDDYSWDGDHPVPTYAGRFL